MAQYTDDNVRTFTAGEAIGAYILVKLSGDFTASIAGLADNAIGVSREAVASGAEVGVFLLNKKGTVKMTASGTITQNAAVYATSSGKISATIVGRKIGYALESASADGDIIEILPIPLEDPNDKLARVELFDDFFHFTTTENFTSILTDSGTAAVSDGARGLLTITASDGTVADNDEAYVSSTAEAFLFADAKPLYFESRVALTEANTDDANVIVGLADAFAANTLLDDGAGPKASYSGAVFYKVDGGTAWLAECSIAGTQTAVTLTGATFPGDGTYQVLGIEFIPTSATVASVNFFIDGVEVGSTDAFTYTSATDMEIGAGVKNGGANNEALIVDYLFCSQVR